jgi:hypothetical protein
MSGLPARAGRQKRKVFHAANRPLHRTSSHKSLIRSGSGKRGPALGRRITIGNRLRTVSRPDPNLRTESARPLQYARSSLSMSKAENREQREG